MLSKHELEVFADYNQFYLQDDDSRCGDLSDSWTEEATAQLLALAPRTVGIGTIRSTPVPVTIEIHDGAPPLDIDAWDHVVECLESELGTPRLVVAGCTDYFPDALLFRLNREPMPFGRRRRASGRSRKTASMEPTATACSSGRLRPRRARAC